MRRSCEFSMSSIWCEKKGKNPTCKKCCFYKKRNYVIELLNKYKMNE